MKRKWTLFTYLVMDIKAAEAMLNRRAAEGWRLERIWLGLLASFVPAEEPVSYCLDWYDPNREDGLDYRTLLADAGWRSVGQVSYWNIYEAPADTAPIQTDGELEYRRFRKKVLRRMATSWGFILALLLLLAVLAPVGAALGLGAVWQYWLEFLATFNTAALAFLCLPLLLAGGLLWSGRLLLRLGQWKGAIDREEPFPVPGQGSALAARLLVLLGDLLLIVFVLCFLLDVITGKVGRPWMIGTIIGALGILGWKQGAEYRRVRRYKAGMAIGAVVLLILSLLPLSWLAVRFQVTPALEGESLFPQAELEKREDDATFLAAHTEWTQWMDLSGIVPGAQLELNRGEGWVLPWTWLADWVTEQYLDCMGTPHPEELSGYENVWLSRASLGSTDYTEDLWLIRRGNTVLWLETNRGPVDTQWLDDLLERLGVEKT